MQLFANIITFLPLLRLISAYDSTFPFPDGSTHHLISRNLDALLLVRDLIDADISLLLPRVDQDSQNNPILNYDSNKQPGTVANKLDPSNPIPDTLTPLPAGASQYRQDAERDKKANPPAKDEWKDHGIPSSSKEGKAASLADKNPLANPKIPEQRKEAADVKAAMQKARDNNKKVAVRIDGKKPSGIVKTTTRKQPPRKAKSRRSIELPLEQVLVNSLVARALDILMEDGENFDDLYI